MRATISRLSNILVIFSWLMLFMAGTSMQAHAATSLKPLPLEKAFAFSASFIRPGVVLLEWQVAPGYMLYANRLEVSATPEAKATYQLPKGSFKQDPEFGRVEILTGEVKIPVMMESQVDQVTLSVNYQGCAQDGFCYPPTHRTILLNLSTMSSTVTSDMTANEKSAFSIVSLLTDQNGVKDLLQALPAWLMVLFFIGLGLLLAFTPCVLPMIPIITSIIVGQKHVPGTKKAFILSLTYVMGMAMTYAIAGMVAASLGSSVQVWLQKPATIAFTSGILVLLALSLFGLYELRFSRRFQNWMANWSNQHEGGTLVGVFFMGVISTLIVSPCVTAPLVGVLIYISQTGNLGLGAVALFALGLGMGVPLLLIGTSASHILPKSGAWMKAIKELFGIFMVGMAIWLLSRIIPLSVTFFLFGLLFLGTALFMGLYLPKLIRFKTVNHLAGLSAALLGIFLMWNGATLVMTSDISISEKASFKVVHNLQDLSQQLMLAKAQKTPVLLDFYAEWCEPCVVMDKKVFALAQVKDALSRFVLLRVDLTQNTPSDGEMLKYFGVIAPPTLLFFNPLGQEENANRIVGELDVNEFLMRLNTFKKTACTQPTEAC